MHILKFMPVTVNKKIHKLSVIDDHTFTHSGVANPTI